MYFNPVDEKVMSFIEYLGTRQTFNQARKQQYLDAFLNVFNNSDTMVVKQHLKAEWYPEKKFARTINSRSDTYKAKIGMYVHAMEQKVFEESRGPIEFFKGVVKRMNKIGKASELFPAYLREKFSSEKNVLCTDYSSFEKSFTPALMMSVEMRLYRWLLRGHRGAYHLLKEKLKYNTIKSKFFTARMKGTRMSGEMDTSLGNSFTNAAIMYYICDLKGYKLKYGMVEGDDGIFSFHDGRMPSEEDFAELGFSIKIKRPHSFGESEFCGNVVAESASGQLTLLSDPVEFIRSFNWSFNPSAASASQKHADDLMFAKAFSYIVTYPACPVIAPICRQILDRLSSSVRESKVLSILRSNEYYYETQISGSVDLGSRSLNYRNIPVVPTKEARVLMWKFFGMDPDEQKFHETHYCANLGTIPLRTTQNIEHEWSGGVVRIDSEMNRNYNL